MNKLILCIFMLAACSVTAFTEQSDYFNTRSTFYTAASLVQFLSITNLFPNEIADSIGYQEPSTQNSEYYWDLISKKYSLNLQEIYLNATNTNEIANAIKASVSKGVPVIVTYKKEDVVHSALTAGARLRSDGSVMGFKMNDSGTPGDDIIDVSTLQSKYWKLKLYSIYLIGYTGESKK